MKPTAADTEKGMSRSHSATIPPVSASGTALNTSRASRAEPSALNRRRKIRAKQTGTTTGFQVREIGQAYAFHERIYKSQGRRLQTLQARDRRRLQPELGAGIADENHVAARGKQ